MKRDEIIKNKMNLRYADLSNAKLRDVDLRYADLRFANLRDANLRDTDLSNADLRDAKLRDANLRFADLSNADLRDAKLRDVNLKYANLRFADLSNAKLRYADLRFANLRYADLRYADLSNADLSNANLSNADLSNANLRDANLRFADLSNAKGLIIPLSYLKQNFEFKDQGFYAYKTFGSQYTPNPKWKIEEKSVIEEIVEFHRTNTCGCGINIATFKWVKENMKGTIWKVLVKYEDFCDVIVPYNTDGKIRCGKCTLVEVVKE